MGVGGLGHFSVLDAFPTCLDPSPASSPPKQLDAYRALSGALAVILSFVSDTKHVVLIHGAWARGGSWGLAFAAFEERGYTVHTPRCVITNCPCTKVP